MIKKILFILILLTLLLFFSCGTGDSGSNTVDNICGQEPCYEGPFQPPWISAYHVGLVYLSPDETHWTHDNRVLESQNFLVFSDESSDQAKIRMKNTAEAGMVMIQDYFNISSEDLGITDLESKIQIYSACWPGKGNPRAGRNGFVVHGYDSSVYLNSEYVQDHQTDTIEHECTHVVQFRLGGLYQRVWAWFTEGVAETVSGGVFQPISCWPEVVEWRQIEDHVNPVSVERLDQIPQNVWGEHYPLFGLAFRYLLDPNGQGRTVEDLKNLFTDISNNVSFAQAFEIHMGMSLEYYEEHFYALMQAYLPASCDEATRIHWQGVRWENFEDPPRGRL